MAGWIEVELDDVFDGLDKMVAAGKDLRPVFRATRADLRNDLKDHFEHAQGPDGSWAPRNPATVEHILSTGGRARNITRKGRVKRSAAKRLANVLGRLRSAWKISYDKRSLEATSIVPWAAVHQYGGVAGRHAHIPARPFAWASDTLLGTLAARVAAHVLAGWPK